MHRFFVSLLAAFLLPALTPAAARLSPLAERPDWSELDIYQETITRAEFERLLDSVYAPARAWSDTIRITADQAEIDTHPGSEPYVLRFASDTSNQRAVSSFWKPKSMIPRTHPTKPLSGLHISIDPGHIGGKWAKMEERWFRIGDTQPVQEGDMTLLVAKMLKDRLTTLGAKVTLTRSRTSPTTSLRPEKLRDEARSSLAQRGLKATDFSVRKESERLFYRVGEIRERARIVNQKLQPDLVLCLHFNAESWGDPARPRLVPENHLHFLVTGAWSAEELSYEDQRFEMLQKLLTRSFYEELEVTEKMAASMKAETGLPPFEYHTPNAVSVGRGPYIWGRNLLANRLFKCPVVYIEPYVMNGKETFARIQAGNYDGTKMVGGKPRKSIYKEYVDGLVDGLVKYYSSR